MYMTFNPEGWSLYRLLDTDLCVLVAYQTFTAQVTTLLHMHSGGHVPHQVGQNRFMHYVVDMYMTFNPYGQWW